MKDSQFYFWSFVFFIISASAILISADRISAGNPAAPLAVVFPSGLDDWAKEETNSFGYWLASSSRIVKLPDGKYQPQFHSPANGTNAAFWGALFEGEAAYDTLEMAQFKLRRAWEIRKGVTDGLIAAFGAIAKPSEESNPEKTTPEPMASVPTKAPKPLTIGKPPSSPTNYFDYDEIGKTHNSFVLPISGSLTNAGIPDDWPWTNIRTEPFIWPVPPPSLTVRWQWDDIRRENRIVEDERKALTEFYKTNTDPNAGFVLATHWLRVMASSTNDVELGYRSDGMVVWRVPPEAKP